MVRLLFSEQQNRRGAYGDELTFNMINVHFSDTVHIQINTRLHAETQVKLGSCFSNMQISWLLLQNAWTDKGNQWPMVAHIKAHALAES